MGPLPTQRATSGDVPSPSRQSAPGHVVARTSLPGNPLAPGAARRFVRAALADWTGLAVPAAATITDRAADDAVLLAAELVTNAVVHAGTNVELLFKLEDPDQGAPAALVLEVSDHHPGRTLRHQQRTADHEPDDDLDLDEYGRGLQLVAALAECWGITYRPGTKTVWARLPLEGWDACPVPGGEPAIQRGLRAAELLAPVPRRPVRDDEEWTGRGALSFLAEASDLLAGQLDEDLVAALAGQLLVPRLADWCAFWLEDAAGADGYQREGGGAPRLARVWHADESALEALRAVLEKEPPRMAEPPSPGPVVVAWPAPGDLRADAGDGTALAYRLVVGGHGLGTLLIGRRGVARVPDAVASLVEDFARRVALAIGAARRYARQVTISRVLQRGLLPSQVAQIPGVRSCVVYEPSDDGLAGGDFYDVFQAGPGARRWCFMLGDVQGSGPEAAVVTGLARPWLRLLAREDHADHEVGHVLDRLNRLLLDDATEAAETAASVVAEVVAEAADPLAAEAAAQEEETAGATALEPRPLPRFLSLLYGELVPLAPEDGGGARCTLACAGHPLPLLLRPDGTVAPAAVPQVLLGVVDDVGYESQTFHLAPGDTLLCVTDGVTERRSRSGRMFDDGDGLAAALAGCAGLPAREVADRIRRAVHGFGEAPVRDDLALLVLQAEAAPVPAQAARH
ncbi:ATP-binding SpoIIE family protein phosphatase [Streptomyces sp. ODS05-4]|uniref:ATP-binding SpoIIE family protein phosphatase n=1 Tax=Streptomyces sp. ODS05-4 TaxID=2944939 RepID=UPI00210B8A9B|nr:ATP-binding SpoIIE family protein phosphatase [Streptomyces sp. ODS05-4]